MAVSELDIKTDLVGQAATMGICLSLLVAFIVLLATTCNWWSSSLGWWCWEPQGPLGLGCWGAFDSRFFEDFYKHCEALCVWATCWGWNLNTSNFFLGTSVWQMPTVCWHLVRYLNFEGHIPGRGFPAICRAWWLTFGELEFGDSWWIFFSHSSRMF